MKKQTLLKDQDIDKLRIKIPTDITNLKILLQCIDCVGGNKKKQIQLGTHTFTSSLLHSYVGLTLEQKDSYVDTRERLCCIMKTYRKRINLHGHASRATKVNS